MTEVDYTNQFNKMVAAGAELVFTPFYYDVMGPYLVPQARSAGFTGVLLGGDGVDSTETTIPDGADLSVYNDVYFVNHYSTELATSDVSKNFIESYEAKYGETPNNFDALPTTPCTSTKPPWRPAALRTPPACRRLWRIPAPLTTAPAALLLR